MTGLVVRLAMAGVSMLDPAPPAAAETSPPLSSPALTAPTLGALSAPVSDSPTVPESTGPVLVVPGMSRRRSAVSTVEAIPRREISPVDPSSGGDLPPLIGPGGVETHSPARRLSTPRDLEEIPPIVLESIPALNEPIRVRETKPKRPIPAEEAEKRAQSTPTRRNPGIFGRLFPSPGNRGPSRPGHEVTVESRDDPAADAALKRRVERNLKDNLGSKLRYYEVRVIDRQVSITARAARFWQKRAARNAIETLPGLAGLNVKVEMLD